jgi:hypothetical protein
MRTKLALNVVLVLLELDLGVTFCEVALTSHNVLTARRNIGNARKALECAVRYKRRVVFSGAEQKSFNSKREKLETMLARCTRNLSTTAGPDRKE